MYTLKEREIPLNTDYDIIVIGGGPAGCTAATAAAACGKSTLLIEATGVLGGMGTAGLVPAWCPFTDKKEIIYKGLAEKVFSEAKKDIRHVDENDNDWVPIDSESLKRVYDSMVTNAGTNVLFNTQLCAVDTDGKGTVTAIIVSNKSGLSAYKSKIYIDCSGDADLAAWAGAEFIKGDGEGDDLQPATHCFVLSNVDEYAYRTGGKLHGENKSSAIYDILKSGKYEMIDDSHICNNLIGPATVGFNAGHIWNVDNTDPESVSKALIKGRQLAYEIKEALAEFYPKAFSNAFLVSTAPLMGIRETRRIIGDYILTTQDYMERREFSDEICRNSYYIDVHHSSKERKLKKENKLKGIYGATYAAGESHGIPYRCLTPKDINNVLVAGRAISCERLVQGSIRVMPVCLAMGEAAGIAASLAEELADNNVHKVDTLLLRKRLLDRGAYLK